MALHASAQGLPLTGGSLSGNLLFSPDANFDIGATGATRPRDVNLSRNLVAGNQVNAQGSITSVLGAVSAAANLKSGAVAVASLPNAATAGAGARYFVTDANSTAFASVVANGGANGVPVYSDGTSWRIG